MEEKASPQLVSKETGYGVSTIRGIIKEKGGKLLSRFTEPYKADLRPGKMVVCKNCGGIGPDFNACIRCKKKIPEYGVREYRYKPNPRIIAKVGHGQQNEYNPRAFDIDCKNARFFVIKSFSEDDIHRSIKYDIMIINNS